MPEHLSNLQTTGVVFSNELLDAMPTRVIEIRSGRIHEVMISLDSDGNLVEALSEKPMEELEALNIIANLPSLEGYRGPLSTRLDDWCRSVSSALQTGFVVTVDYGMEREEYYSMDRSHRLIQTYYRHIDNLSYLQHVGDQDISAHVNFSYFRELALLNNLKSLHSTNQRDWLYDLHFEEVLNVNTDGEFTSRREVALVNRLVEQEGLGGFRVEILQKGLRGICYEDLIPTVKFARDNFRIPPISAQHMAAGLSRK
jgi:SAM-dependent MidA family methyltransferase